MTGVAIGWDGLYLDWLWRVLLARRSGGDVGVEPQHGVFIVEDHPGMRRALRRLVERAPGFTVVGEAASAEEALEKLAARAPAVVLADLNLPGMSGFELIRTLVRDKGVRCVAISAYAEADRVRAALEAGARAFVSKDEPRKLPQVLAEAMEDGGLTE